MNVTNSSSTNTTTPDCALQSLVTSVWLSTASAVWLVKNTTSQATLDQNQNFECTRNCPGSQNVPTLTTYQVKIFGQSRKGRIEPRVQPGATS